MSAKEQEAPTIWTAAAAEVLEFARIDMTAPPIGHAAARARALVLRAKIARDLKRLACAAPSTMDR